MQEALEPALHLSEQPLGARPQCSQKEGLFSEDSPSSPLPQVRMMVPFLWVQPQSPKRDDTLLIATQIVL